MQKNFDLKTVRPFPASGVSEFGRWIQAESFNHVTEAKLPTEKVAAFEEQIQTKVDDIFPTKEIKIYNDDKEFMTNELRKIRRQKSREYRKNKKSPKFTELHNLFLQKKKSNSQEFVQKVEELKTCNLSQFYSKIKALGARLGESTNKSTFTLPEHLQLQLDNEAAAEKIAEHFSSISKEFPPIDANCLPQRVKEKIFHPQVANQAPTLQDYEVYENMKKKKQKSSSVPGDVPVKLKKEFLPELARPAACIFNSITKEGIYPRQWVTEYVTPIPKVNPPESEDDLRNISLTADLSKNYENFLAEWLMPYIVNRIDPGQFGGLSGHSTNHYLIMLYHFILAHTDSSAPPNAILLALIDFSKAFNRINHAKVIIRLSDWGVPGWLLRILISYLSGRYMILRYKGAKSKKHRMPGGSPQGTLLGVLLYLVYVSDIGMDPSTTSQTDMNVPDLPSIPFPPPPAVSEQEIRLKFVDDLSVAECIRLDKQLKCNSDNTGYLLPPQESLLQKRLDEISSVAKMHDMKLNLSKTKLMPFNFTRKFKFEPMLKLDGSPLEVVTETKLLGLTITSDCRWEANSQALVKKGNSRLWSLRRLKMLGASTETLTDIYKLFCRSVLEFGAPVWSGALSTKNKQDIERVQKNALKIIYGKYNTSYDNFLTEIEEDSLLSRRDHLCLTFAKKCLKNPKFKDWFTEGIKTRSGSHFFEIEAKTKRFSNSSIPYLTRLLNKDNVK